MVDWNSPLWIAVSLLAGLGAANWGLTELSNYNLVTEAFGDPGLQTAAYVVIGGAGVLLLYAEVEKHVA